MSATYRDAPEDIKDTAKKIVESFGDNLALTEGAIAAALDTEREKAAALTAKATTLVTLLDDADRNHGGLAGSKTLRAANELRLELSKWGKP